MRTTILLLSVDEAANLAYSLPAAMVQEGCDVVVVDNASTDTTEALAIGHGAEHFLIHRRLSYAAAMNVALARVRTEAVLLLNADCFLEPGYVVRAAARLAGEPETGAVAGKLLRTDGPLTADPPRAIDTAAMVIDRRRKNGLVGHGGPVSSFSRPGEAFGTDGAAALYRTEALRRCALPPRASGAPEVLDEDMELWASDADLAWRLRLLGWRCAYEPAAVARHVRTYSPTTRAQVAERHRRLQFRNRYLMWIKNETRRDLLRDLPFVVGYEVAALGHVLLRERFLLGGYREVWALRRRTLERRAEVQSRRAVRRVPFGLLPPR